MSIDTIQVSLLGVGSVFCLERDASPMVERPRQTANEYAPPAPPPPIGVRDAESTVYYRHDDKLEYFFPMHASREDGR